MSELLVCGETLHSADTKCPDSDCKASMPFLFLSLNFCYSITNFLGSLENGLIYNALLDAIESFAEMILHEAAAPIHSTCPVDL
jgi:hypothetical protein